MATVTINNSPVHSEAIITYPYGVADSGYSCGYHTGLDFAPYGETEANPMLYSVVSGEVVYIETDPNNTLGIYVLILSNDNEYWRYCHMVERKCTSTSRRFSYNSKSNRTYGRYRKRNRYTFAP